MAAGCCCSLAPMASGGTCGCGCWFSIMEDMTWGRGLGASQAFMGGVLVPPVTLSDGGMCLKFRQYLKFLKIILLLGELVICSNILGDKFYFFPYQSWTKWMNLANQNLYLLKWCRQILEKTTYGDRTLWAHHSLGSIHWNQANVPLPPFLNTHTCGPAWSWGSNHSLHHGWPHDRNWWRKRE